MKIKSLLFVFYVLTAQTAFAQGAAETALKPILLDKSTLSGAGLQKLESKEEPEKDFYQKNLFRGQDISVYLVSTESWINKLDDYPFDEFAYMMHGEALIKPNTGPIQVFHSGDYFFAPKGYTGEWEIRAGDHLHYELSVITTRRSTLEGNKEDKHVLFDRGLLSAVDMTFNSNGSYRQVLQKGVELTVSLHGVKNQTKSFVTSGDKLIQLLAGQVTFKHEDGDQTFYTGDFFVIPTNCKGEWIFEGHGFVKYISVEKTKI